MKHRLLLIAILFSLHSFGHNKALHIDGKKDNIISTPTVTTSTASLINVTSAELGGEVTFDGGLTVSERGIVYSSTNTDPEIGGANVTKDTNGNGVGSFSEVISNLSGGTTYYFKAYVINLDGTSYGALKSFTTLFLQPTVTTSIANNVSSGTTLFGGEVIANSSITITDRGVIYATSNSNLIIGGAGVIQNTNGNGAGIFSEYISSLNIYQTYYYRAYAVTSQGNSYGIIRSIYTDNSTATSIATDASSITNNSAVLGGEITSYGGNPIIERGVVYSVNSNPNIGQANTIKKENTSGNNPFLETINGLNANTNYYFKTYVITAFGTGYSPQKSFTTTAGLATIITDNAIAVSATGAQLNGSIYNDGGTTVTSKGFVYSTTNTNPEIGGANVTNETGVTGGNSFSKIISTLTQNTTYYYKAYGINAQGTSYGSVKSFTTLFLPPTVTTSTASLISGTSANFSGQVNSNSAIAVIDRGIIYATSNSNLIIGGAGVIQDTNGSGDGVFSENITGLSTNTLYYFRAYATTSQGTSYGVTLLINTALTTAVSISTDASSITNNSAILGGQITQTGGSPITERGVVYGVDSNPFIGQTNTIKKENTSGNNPFSETINDLSANTTYYFKTFVINTTGTSYGNQKLFTTTAGLATIITNDATSISATNTQLNGSITNNGGATVTTKGFVYSTTNTNPEIGGTNVTNETVVTGGNSFSKTLSTLTQNTTYYYKAYGVNVHGTAYGTVKSFTTFFLPPTVTTSPASSISDTSASLGGEVASNSSITIIDRGIVYSASNINLVIGGAGIQDSNGSGAGIFSENITVFSGNNLYYFRSYATTSQGTSYGNIVSFSTLIGTPAAINTSATNITHASVTLTGNVTYDGGSAVTEKGILYSATETTPEIGESNVIKIPDGNGTGIVTVNITGLLPSTNYYFRTYATNTSFTGYSVTNVFTTAVNPLMVSTQSVTNIDKQSADLGGNITADGGIPITERGVVYSTSDNSPEIGETNVIKKVNPSTSANFSETISGLVSNEQYYIRAYAINAFGVVYGNSILFKTLKYPPIILTTDATNITAITAEVGGNITDIGGAPIIHRGLVYSSLNTDPEIDGTSVSDYYSGGGNVFTETLTNLSPNTLYYVKAFATNASGNGISYGAVKTFSTITSAPIVFTHETTNSQIFTTSANFGGSVTSDGGLTVTERGIVYSSVNTNPEIGGTNVTKDTNGNDVGVFSEVISSLNLNTTYYFKAYGINAHGTNYGALQSLTTKATTPTITTDDVSSITHFSAIFGGNISSDGGATIISKGILYSSTNNNPTLGDGVSFTLYNTSGNTNFSETTNSLLSNATYYYRAFADNSHGLTGYGTVKSFTTLLIPPTVTSSSATLISGTSATFGGEVTSTSGITVIDRGIVYATSNTDLIIGGTGVIQDTNGSGTGTFSKNITGLTTNTLYYFKAYATTSQGTSYGSLRSINTTLTTATSTAADALSITNNSAILGGEIISNGGSPITERGVVYGTDTNPYISQTNTIKKENTSGNNPFAEAITGLNANTIYYFKTYTTNSVATSYSFQKTFTTPAGLATVITNDASDINTTYARLNGSIPNNGGTAVTTQGFVYSSTNNNPEIGEVNVTNVTSVTGAFSFSELVTTFTLNTTYYYKAYGITANGAAYGEVKSFTTDALAVPTVTTFPALSIQTTSAMLGGEITNTGGVSITETGIVFSINNTNPIIGGADVTQKIIGSSSGSFLETIRNLRGFSYYNFRAYAINSIGTAYGPVQNFSTLNTEKVFTSVVNEISGTSAVLGGDTAWDGQISFTERGIVYSSVNTNPEIGSANVTKDTNGTGLGNFSKIISNLNPNTVYYVKAYGTNTNGTTYGTLQTFSTANIGLNFASNNELLFVNDHSDFDFSTNGFTLESWIKLEDLTNQSNLFFQIDNANNTDNGIVAIIGTDGKITFGISPDGVNFVAFITTETLTTNQWYHVVMTSDNTSLDFYIDGVKTNNTVFFPGTVSAVHNSSQPIVINPFKATLDNVRFWTRPLSITEINAYKNCKIDLNTNGLVAYYDFNQGAPNMSNTENMTIIDRTSNPKNGTLISFNLTGITSNFIDGAANISNTNNCNLFTAATNTTWNTNNNWSLGRIPNNTDHATIPSSLTADVNIDNAETNKLSLGGTLNIPAGNSLTIHSDFENNGTTTVNSDATSSGSLIVTGTTSGNTLTYKRYVGTNWHLIGSPIVGQNIETFATNTNNKLRKNIAETMYAIANYDNDYIGAFPWNYEPVAAIASAGDFSSGNGYSMLRSEAGEYTFTGDYQNLNPFTFNITQGTTNNWNLIGNPYPAFIPISNTANATNNFLIANASAINASNLAVYMWNGSEYKPYNHIKTNVTHIAPGQGFFVQAINGGGSLSIPKSMLTHQTGNIFQRNQNNRFEIEVNINDGTTNKTTEIYYVTNTTTGLDPGYDAGTFSGTSSDFTVHSHLVDDDGNTYSLQCLPPDNYEQMIIPLGINALANQTIRLSVHAINVPKGIHIYLEDKITNTFTKLEDKNSQYQFTTTDAISGVGRFYIHTTSQTLSIDDNIITNTNINLYVKDNNILRITNVYNQKVTLQLYDLLGKEIMSKTFYGKKNNDIPLIKSIKNGIYIASLKTNNGNSIVKKILIE
jgi:hypothetical protein